MTTVGVDGGSLQADS